MSAHARIADIERAIVTVVAVAAGYAGLGRDDDDGVAQNRRQAFPRATTMRSGERDIPNAACIGAGAERMRRQRSAERCGGRNEGAIIVHDAV